MKTIINAVKNSIQSFVSGEEGTVTIEYALVATLVSIASVTALGGLATAIGVALDAVTAAL
jgi:Flp pilus assembly pilin Flp